MAWSSAADDEPDEADYAGFDTSESEADPDDDFTVPCPQCGAEIYDQAERCPQCGEYLSRETARAAWPRWWMVIGVLICLAIVAGWVFSGR
jgi:predicted nucleic acid-binding Zn ribbon protein